MSDRIVGTACAWERLASRPVYDGYVRVRRDTYRLPDGSESEWDVLDQGDTVAVIALTPDERVLLFEQYRVGPRRLVAELPGGLVDPGETALAAAARELLEETGHRAAALFHAGSEWSGANSTRRKHVVIAAGCVQVAAPTWETGETGLVRAIGIRELGEHLSSGDLSDAGEAWRGLMVLFGAPATELGSDALTSARDSLRRELLGALLEDPSSAPAEDVFDRFWDDVDLDRPDEARAAMREILRARGVDDARSAYERASLHDALGEEEEAIPHYRDALDRGLAAPHRTQALIQLASSLRNVGRASESIAVLRGIPDEDPLADSARAFLALALHDDDKPTPALRVALRILAPHLPQYTRAVGAYAEELSAPARVRAVAVGLVVRGGHVLLEEYPATRRHGVFLRAPGGGIEAGERAEEAVRREFLEELGVDVTDSSPLAVTENIFRRAGGGGHEIMHVFAVTAPELDGMLVDARRQVRDSHTTVGWYEIAALRSGATPVYPPGTLDLLPR